MNHFLPKTTHSVSTYLGDPEGKHFPSFAEKHEIAKQHSAMTWERVKDTTQNGRETFSSSVATLVGKVEETTELKLRETLGWRERTLKNVETKTREIAETSRESGAQVADAVEAKALEVVDKVEQKVEEPKRLV